ncbi:hypothetical protein [Streptoalloteichus hindustanus]|uniref:Uncharacterized protein n=1 Tax=Streptoalloteichus hindustanus TaxID=2017 RepID=A0A1M4URY4_STRHI|nr:hypothetical protein [Streptoalloteichus hindustanus]SHE59445.1 hypothetical protein SAMN05444320_101525 [Streptoalloteichus hindustanus]
MKRLRRPESWWTALAGVTVLAALAVPATPTHALTRHVCAGTVQTTYDGGLNDVEKPVGVSGVGSITCPVEPAPHTRGRITFSNAGLPNQLSCSTGRTGMAGQITWSDNATTTFHVAESQVHDVSGVRLLAMRGVVTEGDFAGHQVEAGFPVSAREHGESCATARGIDRATGGITIILTN